MKIAIVEDTQAITQLLKYALERNSHEIAVYMNGEDFLASLESVPFDLLILDLMLPGLTGEQVLEELQKRNLLEGMKILIYSAMSEPQKTADLFPEACYEVVRKPARIEELISKLNSLAGSDRA